MKKPIIAAICATILLTPILADKPEPPGSEKIVEYARENCLGKLYSAENRLGPESYDCSGLIWRACSASGYEMSPGCTDSQLNCGMPIEFSELMPGDLIFFDYENDGVTDHGAIYSGDNNMIHATRSGVRETSLDSPTGVYENQTFRTAAMAFRRVVTAPYAQSLSR